MSRQLVLGTAPLAPGRPYPERADEVQRWHDKLAMLLARRVVFPLVAHWTARPGALVNFANQVAAYEQTLRPLDEAALMARVTAMRRQLRRQGLERATVAQSFALIAEAAWRQIGKRHYRCQFMAGWALLQGRLVEMATGEGKTMAAVLPAVVAAWSGMPVHVITVNDYLAERDALLLRPLYRWLGLDVGVIQHAMDANQRREAYTQPVTYCSNKELAFDYLRDRVAAASLGGGLQGALDSLTGERAHDRPGIVLRGLVFGIVDEADSVLIDEARTPLILSKKVAVQQTLRDLEQALEIAAEMVVGRDFAIDARVRRINLQQAGREQLVFFEGSEGLWSSARARAELVTQALSALHLYHRDQHYVVLEGQVQIVDEATGRTMPDRHWERGLQQLIEVKEGCKMSEGNETIARITYQRLFKRYLRLSGMTGTAAEVAAEVRAVYRPALARVPLNRKMVRTQLPDRVFNSAAEKWSAVADVVEQLACCETRPVLVGTRSVQASEQISALLTKRGIAHALLNAKQDEGEAEIVAQAGLQGRVTVATNMAGRGTDIVLGPTVAERGGMHVVLTEFHDSRRIDRQLYGRCARQGDPGSCQAMVAWDDELFLRHAPLATKVARTLSRGMPAVAPWLLKAVRSVAQDAAEQHDAFLRAQTLKSGEQLGKTLAFSGRGE